MDFARFNYVCDITPDRDNNGDVKEFSPQKDYDNKKGLKLNKYGDGSFCKFKIPKDYQKAGVYIISVDESPKYVGECENLSIRFNSGYGNISPRNCYTGGQQTNCRINKLILDSVKNSHSIKLFFQETNKKFMLEEMLIDQLSPEWNKTKRNGKPPMDRGQKVKPQKKSSGKYHKLQKYLEESQKNNEVLKYSQIGEILGFQLPRSAYDYGAWWANGGHKHANAWLNAGWMVLDVVLGKFVNFVKISRRSDFFILDGKEHRHFCGTPFVKVREKNKKHVCRKCGRPYSSEEFEKSRFCIECGTFLHG